MKIHRKVSLLVVYLLFLLAINCGIPLRFRHKIAFESDDYYIEWIY